MRKHNFLPIIMLFALSLFQACTDGEKAIEPEQSDVEIVLLTENSHLQNLVSTINRESSINGRTNSLLSEVNFERAVKKYDSETGNTHFSFSMRSDDGLAIRKFILSENSINEISGHVFEYRVDAGWLAEVGEFPGWDQYNGFFRIIDLEGIVVSENEIVAGSSVNKESTNGRTTGIACETRVVIRFASSPRGVDAGFAYYTTETNCYSYGMGSGGDESEQYDPYQEGIGVEMGPTDFPVDGNGGEGSHDLPPAELWKQNNITRTDRFRNNPCISGVDEQLMATNELYKLAESFMMENPTAQLIFDVRSRDWFADKLLESTGAITVPSEDQSHIVIVFDEGFLDAASPLAVASVFGHEIIHAEILRKLIESGYNEDVLKQKFPDLYDDLDTYFGTSQDWTHDAIATRYLGKLKNLQMAFDNTQNSLTNDALLWLGLQFSKTWRDDLDETTREKYRAKIIEEINKGGCN